MKCKSCKFFSGDFVGLAEPGPEGPIYHPILGCKSAGICDNKRAKQSIVNLNHEVFLVLPSFGCTYYRAAKTKVAQNTSANRPSTKRG